MNRDQLIRVSELNKVFRLYDSPSARLKEALHPFGKTYSREFPALTDVSFTINRGESLGILGRNGAGKSTLLKIITGVLPATKGLVEVNGRVSSLLELGTGFDPELTGIENLYLYGSLMGVDEVDLKSRIGNITAFADIGDFVYQQVKNLSSGMFARLAFAAAINVTPEILIVDEVLSVGDSAFQKKCINRINELRESGVSLLLVSHDEYLVRQLCEKAIFLENGVSKFYGEAELCLKAYKKSLIPNLKHSDDESEAATKISRSDTFAFFIEECRAETDDSNEATEIQTGEDLTIAFRARCEGRYTGMVSFVVNIYSEEGVYVCGTTTIMDGIEPVRVDNLGEIRVKFCSIPLLSGNYTVRVAVNDESGLCILAEANPAVALSVRDSFGAVGLVDLQREWVI